MEKKFLEIILTFNENLGYKFHTYTHKYICTMYIRNYLISYVKCKTLNSTNLQSNVYN